jgi:hypothetical protein
VVLFVDCPPVSDMTMRSENYRVRGKELTDLLDSGALPPVASRLFVFVATIDRTTPFS